MKIEFTLSKEDFLQLQLFMATHSEQIIKSRKKSRWRVPIFYVLMGLGLIFYYDQTAGIVFFVLALLWFFFYPVYLAKRFVKIYTKNIVENYSNRFEKPIVLTFTDDYIETKDYQGESKLIIKEIVRIDEIRDYCFLKFTSGVSLVIPVCKLVEKDSLIEYLKKMATTNGIAWETNIDWKWK